MSLIVKGMSLPFIREVHNVDEGRSENVDNEVVEEIAQ
jgi:hypothetical protein